MEALISSAKALADTLDISYGSEHPRSKSIRRYLDKFNGTKSDLISKFKAMIDHEDGLFDSIDNDLIQLCYAQENIEDEHDRVQMCIALITAKTAFAKNLIAVA